MSVLTIDEITDLTGAAFDDHAWEGTTVMNVALARAVEAAVIKHLAAGVSVEPSAYRFTENRGNGNTEFNYYGLDEVGMAYRDNCLEITPLYTATAIAAARVQAINDCAEELDGMKCNSKTATSAIKQCAEAIRALLGKEAQS